MSGTTLSGLYEWSDPAGTPFAREELRFDIDGNFPQMTASGTGFSGLTFRVHWVARPLTSEEDECGAARWTGPIISVDGTPNMFPFTTVTIEPVGSGLRVVFSGTGMPDLERDFTFVSPHFREVMLEYDAEEGFDLVLDYDTGSHPVRPAALLEETLTIDTVFERAGFQVHRTGGDSIVPSEGSGGAWSNMEMHDAMQVHFSTLASLPPGLRDRARWALWTFFAGIHEDGFGLGGIMFDSIGASERQGTSLFLDSFISSAPTGDVSPTSWVRRMAFWTAIHEMGHAFNLLHAWEKHLGTPWMPQVPSFDLISFMNYPFLYQTGSQSNANTIRFFRDFDFRFSDDELFFLRHAPEAFVQMGNSDFGRDHAFEQARVSPDPAFALELRTHRPKNEYEFMEPVMIELKLTNRLENVQLVDSRILDFSERMTVTVQRRGGRRMSYRPYAMMCFKPNPRTLEPGESIYAPFFASTGSDGWMIDEPGWYEIQIALHFDDEDVVSNKLRVRIAPPMDRHEEYLAQDYFSDDVGRVLHFDGTRALEGANDVLEETTAKMKDRKVAIHARVALNMPKSKDYKLLTPTDDGMIIRMQKADEKATEQLAKALGTTKKASEAAALALGHIDYHHYVDKATSALQDMERDDLGMSLKKSMLSTFKKRDVVASVLENVQADIKKMESRKK